MYFSHEIPVWGLRQRSNKQIIDFILFILLGTRTHRHKWNDFDNDQYLKRISNKVSVEPDVKPAAVTEHNSLEIIRFMNTRWPQHKPFEKLLVGYKIQLWWKRRWFRTLHFAITRSVKYIKRAYTIPLAQGDQTCACLLNMFTYRHTIFHSVINYKQIIFYSPFCFRIGVFWRENSLKITCPLTGHLQCGMSESVSACHWQEFGFIPPAAQRGGLSRRCHAHGTLAKRLMRMAMAPKSGTTSGVSGFRETCVSRSLTLRVETNEAFSRWTTLACHRLARVAACCNHCSHALLQRGYAICASPARSRHLRFSSAVTPSTHLQRGHAICASPARSRHRRISSAVTPCVARLHGVAW